MGNGSRSVRKLVNKIGGRLGRQRCSGKGDLSFRLDCVIYGWG